MFCWLMVNMILKIIRNCLKISRFLISIGGRRFFWFSCTGSLAFIAISLHILPSAFLDFLDAALLRLENPPYIVTKYAARLHKYQQASTPSGQKLKYETACFAPLYRWISGHRMPLKFRLALARKHTSAYFNLWLDGVKLSHGIFFSEARVLLYKLWLALLSVIQYKALISEGMEIQMNKM